MPAPQLSVDTVEDPVSNTNVAKNATDVNAQSMRADDIRPYEVAMGWRW